MKSIQLLIAIKKDWNNSIETELFTAELWIVHGYKKCYC